MKWEPRWQWGGGEVGRWGGEDVRRWGREDVRTWGGDNGGDIEAWLNRRLQLLFGTNIRLPKPKTHTPPPQGGTLHRGVLGKHANMACSPCAWDVVHISTSSQAPSFWTALHSDGLLFPHAYRFFFFSFVVIIVILSFHFFTRLYVVFF